MSELLRFAIELERRAEELDKGAATNADTAPYSSDRFRCAAATLRDVASAARAVVETQGAVD